MNTKANYTNKERPVLFDINVNIEFGCIARAFESRDEYDINLMSLSTLVG